MGAVQTFDRFWSAWSSSNVRNFGPRGNRDTHGRFSCGFCVQLHGQRFDFSLQLGLAHTRGGLYPRIKRKG